ncbi:MAG: UDP-N-acetylmuramoyl-L-alanine--D-glutamate ligase [Cytophagales bacterium]|nr:UDP-N-acetylmuramoyl-L-alanine--D-glutamate ligase [Cytophagales bacterium]
MQDKNNKIVVLGAGESGTGAALLAKAKGYDVFVSDSGKIGEKYKQKLQDAFIDFEENKHTESIILTANEIVKSPGIPDKSEIILKAKKQKINIIGEIEFAGRFTYAKKICITGTNGKTTTTLLTYHILKKAGYNVGLGGNVGNSFAEMVIHNKHDWYVLEISSFMLDNMYDFKADIGVITNITPDHLDRYDYKIDKYVQSKFRIIQNMDEECYFIYGIDSDLIEQNLIDIDTQAIELPFSVYPDEFDGACGDEDFISIQYKGQEYIIDIKKSILKGRHNVYNTMAAALAAITCGVSPSIIEQSLQDFSNAEHRMQDCGTIRGIKFVNDSKATNVDSAFYALEAFKQPMIWIAGGIDKGNDYTQLYPVVKDRVKALICLGKDNDKLISAFHKLIPTIKETQNIEECINMCLEIGKEGDIVLLSPCCASFDLFANYEDRGKQFMESVAKYDNSR